MIPWGAETCSTVQRDIVIQNIWEQCSAFCWTESCETIPKVRVLYHAGNFLIPWANTGFSKAGPCPLEKVSQSSIGPTVRAVQPKWLIKYSSHRAPVTFFHSKIKFLNMLKSVPRSYEYKNAFEFSASYRLSAATGPPIGVTYGGRGGGGKGGKE
jgi:hypothetical protein